MFPSFISILDIQSWWEVPSIAYFCSLFRTAFNLLDFDIEELEEALLTDGTEESASSLLTELIVRLLNGCLGNNDISAFNYQMYLRRLFRRKCQETSRYNPFNTDIDFQFLPLRTKVEILYALCDFRLDAEDVFDLFKNLEAESLRVEPLGWDDNDSAYWYFYGTRLYREDITTKPKGRGRKRRSKDGRCKRSWFYGNDRLRDEKCHRVWQVVCFTEADWAHLTEKFSKASSKVEKELYRSLSQNFLPEIPRLFQEKERLQRKRLLELAPRRTSNRVLQKIKQKEEETKQSSTEENERDKHRKERHNRAREFRAKRRNLLRTQSTSSDESSNEKEMPQKIIKRRKHPGKKSKNSSVTHKGEPPPGAPIKTGRKTNNSLSSATGQILISDTDEPANSNRKKLKTSQIQTEEDIQIDMYKVLEQLTAHEDAWPFLDPVEEEYAPNYYAVIRRPMDLRKMEERLDNGLYTDFSMFKADFKLIVNNCRLYNGQDNEYTIMVDNLQAAFDRLTEKYVHRLSSSDEEIAVEYPMPTPSRKHKLKTSESPSGHKRKKRKSNSDTGDIKSSNSDQGQDGKQDDMQQAEPKESRKTKDGKIKKKRRGHHRHGKHSKSHKRLSRHRSGTNHESKSSKHNKKKHLKEGKKSKQKKKKSKHSHENEDENKLKKAVSQESLESSNRSRSASPLPSIHSPTPSPEPDQLNDPDFFKDKYDKIKERRRNAAKDAWESLFDYKQKSVDKQKQNIRVPGKEKNQKLRETIEKLKAKNEKYKDASLFNSLFASSSSFNTDKMNSDTNLTRDSSTKDNDEDYSDIEFNINDQKDTHGKGVGKKTQKIHSSAKNESASEALEQAVKDISKLLDDAPKESSLSSPCDSPVQTISTEDHDNSRQDDESSQSDKGALGKKELSRKRPSSREPKVLKRREIQRTIERLQPGKSKGNLLTNIPSTQKVDESTPHGPLNKVRDVNKVEESSPKLSLGSVLPTVEFTLGNDHNFDKNEEIKDTEKDTKTNDNVNKVPDHEQVLEKQTESVTAEEKKMDIKVDSEPSTSKASQEKATPNLSAWFKAFGTPKSTTPPVPMKKKGDDNVHDDKSVEIIPTEAKPTSPKNTTKYDSPTDEISPNPEGGDSSPLPNVIATPRQRRTSTGSSVSERSSFSQDLDSPRHQMSHTSPLLRSPASPRTDEFQKITYPIINGTVRAGFYQDTTSIKSSPEKSCSPREAPQSPYSPYSQHVYASNNAAGSATPNYFVDHNKSPLPTYGQNPPPYYDSSKAPVINKPGRTHDDYIALGPDTFPPNHYSGPYSSAASPYSQEQLSPYAHEQHSPHIKVSRTTAPTLPTQTMSDPKNAFFPVKKRAYNENELTSTNNNTLCDKTDGVITNHNKNEYQKIVQSMHSITALPSASVDEIAIGLTEKADIAKLNAMREKGTIDYSDRQRQHVESRDHINYENNENTFEKKKEISKVNNVTVSNKDNIDMINMGYNNPDIERRISGEANEIDFIPPRDLVKHNLSSQHKGYEVEPVAMNLGMNSQHHLLQKSVNKNNMNSVALPLEKTNVNAGLNQNLPDYEAMAVSGQNLSNFSLNDIELANKKLYSCNSIPSNTGIDYGNWKLANQMRKQDMLPSDYSTYGSNNSDKLKADITSNVNVANYNKNLHQQQQQQQYHSYNSARSNLQRTQELQQNLPSELRIPNPRGILKSDSISTSASHGDSGLISKNIEATLKAQKSEKLIQSHPLVSSLQYKPAYSTHSSLQLESLRNLQNIPQMLERYTNDERYLSSFAAGTSSLYHDKSFQMAQMTQMFNKSVASDIHPSSTSASIYSQPAVAMTKDTNIYKAPINLHTTQVDVKSKSKRKRTSDTKQSQMVTNQSFHSSSCTTDVLSKTSMVPGSAFNFGTSPNMTLGSGLYGENSGFSIEDFRNSTNQLMAANYMAAAVAHQRNNTETSNNEKMAKPAHQSSSHSTAGSFPFISHSQVRAGYPFVGADPSSPLYQQYLQRHQEELLRQTGAQIMGLYPPGYPGSLSVRQPYDSINRPSWI